MPPHLSQLPFYPYPRRAGLVPAFPWEEKLLILSHVERLSEGWATPLQITTSV